MRKIEASIIADSITKTGSRLTSFVLQMPRIILSEFNTHRVLSRNSASSRAIPFNKMVEQVIDDPFIPIAFQKKHRGMQGTEYFIGEEHSKCVAGWLQSRDRAVESARHMDSIGVTKQLCNRIIEPYVWHTVIATGTEWGNFFSLRAHSQAEIHIEELAERMLEEYNTSKVRVLKNGEWHIPFGDNIDDVDEDTRVKIAVARCARVSYLNFDGSTDRDADIAFHDRLIHDGHCSPFEHCAKVDIGGYQGGNLGKDWKQYRKFFVDENRSDSRIEVLSDDRKIFH